MQLQGEYIKLFSDARVLFERTLRGDYPTDKEANALLDTIALFDNKLELLFNEIKQEIDADRQHNPRLKRANVILMDFQREGVVRCGGYWRFVKLQYSVFDMCRDDEDRNGPLAKTFFLRAILIEISEWLSHFSDVVSQWWKNPNSVVENPAPHLGAFYKRLSEFYRYTMLYENASELSHFFENEDFFKEKVLPLLFIKEYNTKGELILFSYRPAQELCAIAVLLYECPMFSHYRVTQIEHWFSIFCNALSLPRFSYKRGNRQVREMRRALLRGEFSFLKVQRGNWY